MPARVGAVGTADIAAGAAGAGPGQPIEVGSGDIGAAMEADIGIAHVIADDDEDVGSAGLLCTQGGTGQQQCQKEEGVAVHGGAPVRGSCPRSLTWDGLWINPPGSDGLD